MRAAVRVARTLGVGLAVTALTSTLGAAPAVAVTPPTVDSRALVRSAPVAPTEKTEQRTLCAAPRVAGGRDLSIPSAAQRMMNLPEAWRFSRGAGQKVAVIDTGVTPHPRLGRVQAGGDYVSNGNGLSDCDAHGTLVAGIIAARPSSADAFAGVAPAADILSIRQSSGAYAAKDQRRRGEPDPTVGAGYGSVRTLASAVVRAVDLGSTVINISEVACSTSAGRLNDRALGAAVKYAFDRDVVVVVAAGNLSQGSSCGEQNPTPAAADTTGWNSVRTIASPAWFTPYVLTVGSVDAGTGAPSPFSLHGPWLGVAAPGTDIVSLDSRRGSSGLVDAQQGDQGPVPILGTSFATPYVSGTVALVRARYPKLSAAEVIERVTRSAHAPGTGRDGVIGHGVIDPVAALTGDLAAEQPDATKSKAIAAPTPQSPPDTTARTVAVVGVGVSILVIAAVLGIAMPHRRVKRLDPDDF
ncbi:type VII secretion-associated serine protease mycosin [Gordonia soli]|uniref:Peptidase S8 family protein n=1 Tax=Gordonia soli NBRC 108243 TaxID=1223545 RepID=M0QQH5_9ACTN|nr:type VII secretion-associated serine protease mycosin [Gordonia soli]GAC70496.1 peptidase S8 family protein [Gordonia soli NBRC 108243]